MFPFYLYAELQCVPVTIVQDNAKTHKHKSSGRRQQFARSHSEPLVTAPRVSLGRGARSSKTLPQKPRPQMNRWNSFTNRSTTQVIHEEDTSKETTSSLMVNASKPVRRGSWGSSGFITKPTRAPTFEANRETPNLFASPMRASQ